MYLYSTYCVQLTLKIQFSLLSLPLRSASSFNQDISNWNVGSATNMHRMFQNAIAFNQDLPWSAPYNEDMAYMFSGATSFQGDVSAFDTSSVVSMERTFSGINYNPDITNWNVENLYTAASMYVKRKRQFLML